MDKVVDLNRSIKDLCSEYPEIIEIMKTLGFDNITNPVMLNTAGRFMTIKKGAEMKMVDLETIKAKFIESGFKVTE